LHPLPVRTAAQLATHSANAQKSTAPGEARVALNGLQQGGRTDRLPEKPLGRLGDWEGQALYRWFQAETTATLGRGRPQEERWAGTERYPGGPVQLRLRRGAGSERWSVTSKAGMSFSFMGIMLATTPSIKDSG
jgi:hypothetical protein